MVKYVHLSNGEMFRITVTDADGSMYYFNKDGKKRKVRKDQRVIDDQEDADLGASFATDSEVIDDPDDVDLGASSATDSELFRVPLPSAQKIWVANKDMDKYTGLSKEKTEKFGFEDLSKSEIVKDYKHFVKERAIKVERDHTVEIQMVSHAWDRVKGKQPNTRSNVKCIRESVNHLDNLNCTLGAVNMKKNSAVKKFLKDYERKDGNDLRQNLLHYGVGPNTTRRICTTYEEAAYKISDKVAKEGTKVHDDFADKITSMIGHMKLD